MVEARKNSCQIYGYDFLIDDQLRVWLLEINSSPTMEASTPITSRMCAEVQVSGRAKRMGGGRGEVPRGGGGLSCSHVLFVRCVPYLPSHCPHIAYIYPWGFAGLTSFI
jgi:hypothetical protein